jgi:hypothetical protein
MQKLITICAIAALTYLLAVGAAFAVPVQWPVGAGGNNHYYDAVSFPQGITWDDALVYASGLVYQGLGGHLATITFAEENNFIIDNLGGPIALNTYWLGGFQPPGSPEPAGNWRWVTGEPWLFTNWASGEANNSYGGDGIIPRPELMYTDEEALQFWANSGQWNDMEHTVGWGGLIVEYEVPEPATICLLGLGALSLLRRKR